MLDRFSVIRGISQDSEINLIRFPGEYVAEQAGEAFAREALGESGRGAGAGVGHAIYASGKVTGASYGDAGPKATIFLTLLDKTHRQDAKRGGFADANDRAFEFATRTIADLTAPERNLPYLEICRNFQTWEKINLAGLPLFPALVGSAEDFSVELVALQKLGQRIKKLASKVSYIKDKKLAKGRYESHGFSVEYIPPTGMTTTIVDANGEKVKNVPRIETNHIQLRVALPELPKMMDVAELLPEYLGKLIVGEINLAVILPVAMKGLEVMRGEYELRYAAIRPYELGIIEQAWGKETTVTIGGVAFEIIQTDVKDSDKPADIGAKIKTGEYREIIAPADRGKWNLTEVPASVAV